MAVSSVTATLNGVTYSLSLNEDSGDWEGAMTAPGDSSYNLDGGYYPITVKATDSAGNSATVDVSDADLGDNLKLTVYETTPPVISIQEPTEDEILSNNLPTITWIVNDDDSGVDPDTIGITIDSGTKITGGITKTVISTGYYCSYTISEELSDGTHTVYIDASDNDGNEATQRTVNFVVDTVPPELSVTSPVNNLATNEETVAVAGTTTDDISSTITVTVSLNGGEAEEVTVGSNGAFSTTVTLVEGSNQITITATDEAGQVSSITRVVTLDTYAPVIKSVTVSPNPVSTGEILTVSATVVDD